MRSHRWLDGEAVHGFSTLLAQLGTLTRDRLRPQDGTTGLETRWVPTHLQPQAPALLGLQPMR